MKLYVWGYMFEVTMTKYSVWQMIAFLSKERKLATVVALRFGTKNLKTALLAFKNNINQIIEDDFNL